MSLWSWRANSRSWCVLTAPSTMMEEVRHNILTQPSRWRQERSSWVLSTLCLAAWGQNLYIKMKSISCWHECERESISVCSQILRSTTRTAHSLLLQIGAQCSRSQECKGKDTACSLWSCLVSLHQLLTWLLNILMKSSQQAKIFIEINLSDSKKTWKKIGELIRIPRGVMLLSIKMLMRCPSIRWAKEDLEALLMAPTVHSLASKAALDERQD